MIKILGTKMFSLCGVTLDVVKWRVLIQRESEVWTVWCTGWN